jgi:dephospho-CoA kinase
MVEHVKVIGLLGGVASGKSQVAELLEELGARRIDADRAGYDVLRMPHVRDALVQRWGDQILSADGQIDRRAVAQIVFGPSASAREELDYLEKLTHPLIGERIRRQAHELASAGDGGPVRAIVLDAPVMLETGWNEICHNLLYVDAPRDVRLRRARQRGWSEDDFAAREAAQESLDVKRRAADVIVDNSGSLESTRAQIARFWQMHIA